MIKRIIEISSQAMRLSVRNEQLCLHEQGEGGRLVRAAPCEDVGVVLIEHPRTTLSQSVVTTLARYGAIVVFCGRDHLPVSASLPFSGHTEVVERLHEQIAAGKPAQKRMWQQVVRAKIAAQADNLAHAPSAQIKLHALVRHVKSGDPANVEAHAARVYWPVWLSDTAKAAVMGGEAFHRDTDGDGLNSMLNYGYAVVRAAVARSLVSAGLQPALGIHHSNRSNAFALADDLVEPLRPAVERVVQGLAAEGVARIDSTVKRALLSVLHETFVMGDQAGPLMVMLHRYSASFLRCLTGVDKRLEIPRLPADQAGVAADADD